MATTWIPFQEKENSAVVFQPFSKARASGIVRSSKYDRVPKKKVFGDVGNKIQKFDNDKESMNKFPTKPIETLQNCDDMEEEVWPEPEKLPANICSPEEDDFEDCWPLHLRFSKKGWQNLGNVMEKCRTPAAKAMPDSPFSFKPPHEPDEIALDLQIEPVLDILPPPWD